MAGSNIDLILSLIDKVTNPLKRITAQTRKSTAAFEAMNGLFRDSTGRLRDMRGRFVAMGGAAEKAGAAGQGMGLDFAGGLMNIGKWATIAGGAVLALGAVSFARAGVHAALFGERSALAFKTLMKGTGNATAQFERVQEMAIKFGLPMEDTLKSFQKLLAMQFTPTAAEEILKMSADLRAVGASADEVSRALLAISQIKATGKLQGDELMQLAEAGVSVQLVYEALGKQMGKTVPEIMKLKEAGKIGADDAIKAIQQAVLFKVGKSKLGEAGEEIANSTLEGAVGVFKARMGKMFLDLGKDLLPGLKKVFATINQIAEGVMPEIKELFAEAGKALGDLFEGPGAKDFVKNLISDLKFVIRTYRSVIPVAKEFLSGFIQGFAFVQGPMREFGSEFLKIFGDDKATQLKNLGAAANFVGKALGAIVGTIAFIAHGIFRMAAAVIAGADLIITKLTEVVTFAKTTGANIVNGLVSGMLGGLPLISTAAKALGNAATLGLSSALKTHSPSKVFQDLGTLSALGYAKGLAVPPVSIEAASAKLAKAAAMPTLSSTMGTKSADPTVAGGGGGTTNVTNNLGGITVNTTSNDGKELAGLIRREVERVLMQKFGGAMPA